jgi:hypothetical protein
LVTKRVLQKILCSAAPDLVFELIRMPELQSFMLLAGSGDIEVGIKGVDYPPHRSVEVSVGCRLPEIEVEYEQYQRIGFEEIIKQPSGRIAEFTFYHAPREIRLHAIDESALVLACHRELLVCTAFTKALLEAHLAESTAPDWAYGPGAVARASRALLLARRRCDPEVATRARDLVRRDAPAYEDDLNRFANRMAIAC